jgi:predicted O-linked N-acetylglucosamine transferase (SPINDLY family)
LKRYDEAVLSFEQTISLEPNLADAKRNLGNAYYYQERFNEAAEVYEQAEILSPGKAEGYWLLGRVYSKLGRQTEALKTLKHALSIDSSKLECYQGIAELYRLLGRYDEAYVTLKTALSQFPNDHVLLGNFLFDLNYSSEVSSSEIFTWHRTFGERFETAIKAERLPHSNIPDPNKRLRIGFVSGDFRQHPVGYFMESLLSALSKSNLDLYAYINQPVDDELTGRLRQSIDVWHDTWKQPDLAVAEQVRADGIDILIDLSGHTAGNRLMMFARKPAPVQVSYLGYSCTTGLTGIDYIIGNKWLMPEEGAELYTERPYPLPGTQICFTPPTLELPCGALPALKNGHVTFGCFNNLSKMSHATVACWSNILHAVPNSKLLLKSKELDSAEVRASVLSRFAQHRIVEERLILLGRTDNFREHLATYQMVDIALDPFPYNGTTTSMDCLWMGVPILNLRGDRYISRVGLSILQIMQMPDWVADSEVDYVRRATHFASDLTALIHLRAELRQRFIHSSLCDASGFANELETAFRTMWRDWCSASTSDQTS